MKQLLSVLCIGMVVACSHADRDDVRFSGTVSNARADSLLITGADYRKAIALKPEGRFQDTMKVDKGYYTLTVGDHQVKLFLDNGYRLQMSADADSFYSTLSYRGRGSDNNNFIAQRVRLIEYEIGSPRDYFVLDREAFRVKLDTLRNQLEDLFTGKKLDSALVAREKQINERWLGYLIGNYKQQHEIYSGIERGDPSPRFENFIQYRGGMVSFSDLTGQPIYFFIWSSECNACLSQFPAIRSLQQQYRDKGIRFVGISVDEDQDRWRKTLETRQPGGIQLNTGSGLYREFMRKYNITEPPRYILVDGNGNIIDAFASSPSDPELETLFEQVEG